MVTWCSDSPLKLNISKALVVDYDASNWMLLQRGYEVKKVRFLLPSFISYEGETSGVYAVSEEGQKHRTK